MYIILYIYTYIHTYIHTHIRIYIQHRVAHSLGWLLAATFILGLFPASLYVSVLMAPLMLTTDY